MAGNASFKVFSCDLGRRRHNCAGPDVFRISLNPHFRSGFPGALFRRDGECRPDRGTLFNGAVHGKQIVMSEHDCIFCRIVAGQLPSVSLYEDEHSKAFMDINPVARGHALVVSKVHAETMLDIPLPALEAVAATVQKIARAIQTAFLPDGISIVQSNGPGAAQSVPHFHMHVLPRSFYDDLAMNWRLTPGDRRVIEEAAQAIRAALKG